MRPGFWQIVIIVALVALFFHRPIIAVFRALAGGAIVGVASAIPLLGSLVRAVAVVYMVGYVLQSIYLGMREPAPTDKLEGTVG